MFWLTCYLHQYNVSCLSRSAPYGALLAWILNIPIGLILLSVLSYIDILNLNCRGDFKLFQKYKGVLQCILAVVNAYTDLDSEHRDEVLSAEKVFASRFWNTSLVFAQPVTQAK